MDFCQTNRLVTDCLARWERPSVFRWIVVVEIQGEAVGGERPFVIRQMVANRPAPTYGINWPVIVGVRQSVKTLGKTDGLVTDCLARWERPFVIPQIVANRLAPTIYCLRPLIVIVPSPMRTSCRV